VGLLLAWVWRLRRSLAETAEALDKQTCLRADERKGRTAAEKMLKENGKKQAAAGGFCFSPIGHVNTPFPDRRGTPRQGTVAPSVEATLVFDRKRIQAETLDSLADFSHVWLIFVFHDNTTGARKLKSTEKKGSKGPHQAEGAMYPFSAKVTPPRLGRKVGVFSTRSPHRPCPIGLSVCSLLEVDLQNTTLRLGGVDLCNGTPILDIKPYIPYDSVQCSVPEWVMPPVDGDLTSGLVVEFSSEALASLDESAHALEIYAGRKGAFLSCVQEVISQDPRSVLLKKADALEKLKPFILTIDNVELTFEAQQNRMLVTGTRTRTASCSSKAGSCSDSEILH
jgi:tRNA (Thr-GGU) A37 N-methylase